MLFTSYINLIHCDINPQFTNSFFSPTSTILLSCCPTFCALLRDIVNDNDISRTTMSVCPSILLHTACELSLNPFKLSPFIIIRCINNFQRSLKNTFPSSRDITTTEIPSLSLYSSNINTQLHPLLLSSLTLTLNINIIQTQT